MIVRIPISFPFPATLHKKADNIAITQLIFSYKMRLYLIQLVLLAPLTKCFNRQFLWIAFSRKTNKSINICKMLKEVFSTREGREYHGRWAERICACLVRKVRSGSSRENNNDELGFSGSGSGSYRNLK